MKLGIICIVVPIAAGIFAAIFEAILGIFLPMESDFDTGDFASIGLGLMFIILSVIFKYGAELQAKKEESDKPAEPQEEIEEQPVQAEPDEMQNKE